jgi:peptidoglycan/LPS O-acetylase OafA/YrhL
LPRSARSVFLERRSYRRRRMMDALRLLPILGALLWVLPVIWPDGGNPDAEPVRMSQALYYVFGIWMLLIALAAFLALLLRSGGDEGDGPEDGRGDRGS